MTRRMCGARYLLTPTTTGTIMGATHFRATFQLLVGKKKEAGWARFSPALLALQARVLPLLADFWSATTASWSSGSSAIRPRLQICETADVELESRCSTFKKSVSQTLAWLFNLDKQPRQGLFGCKITSSEV